MGSSEFEILSNIYEKEAIWLCKIIKHRINFFHNKDDSEPIQVIPVNDFKDIKTNYTNFIITHELSFEERLLLILAIIPNLKPHLLQEEFRVYGMTTEYCVRNVMSDYTKEFPEILLANSPGGTLATGLTFLFLMAGRNTEQRLRASMVFQKDTALIKEKVLRLESTVPGNIFYSGKIILSESYFKMFTAINIFDKKNSPHEN